MNLHDLQSTQSPFKPSPGGKKTYQILEKQYLSNATESIYERAGLNK